MKRFTAIATAITLALFAHLACAQKTASPKAGTAKAEDMLRLVPKDVIAVFFVDFHRAMQIESLSKTFQENKSNETLKEFIDTTGIDPQKDIYFIAGGLAGEMEQKPNVLVIINLKYNRETLLSLVKEKMEKEEQLLEEEYAGYKIYSVKKGEEGVSFSFIDDSNLFAGDEISVKSGLDVLQKKKDNVFKNEALSSLIAKTNKEAILWGAVAIPHEAQEKVASANPFLSALKDIHALSLGFDYRNKNIIVEIKAMSSDPSKNHEVADFLNSIKTMGAMTTIQDFNLGELLDKIEITSGPDHVRIYARFPENFFEELKSKLKIGEKSVQPTPEK